jgi:hypothetical protein
MPLGSALTVTCGNITFQSVLTRILSSFSKVGVYKLLVQVNYRPDSSSSLKFKLFMTTLNREGHLSLYLLLFFSLGLRMMLKSPPTIIGILDVSHIQTSSLRKFSLSLSYVAPYTAIKHHSKLASLLRSLNFKEKLPFIISSTSNFS